MGDNVVFFDYDNLGISRPERRIVLVAGIEQRNELALSLIPSRNNHVKALQGIVYLIADMPEEQKRKIKQLQLNGVSVDTRILSCISRRIRYNMSPTCIMLDKDLDIGPSYISNSFTLAQITDQIIALASVKRFEVSIGFVDIMSFDLLKIVYFISSFMDSPDRLSVCFFRNPAMKTQRKLGLNYLAKREISNIVPESLEIKYNLAPLSELKPTFIAKVLHLAEYKDEGCVIC